VLAARAIRIAPSPSIMTALAPASLPAAPASQSCSLREFTTCVSQARKSRFSRVRLGLQARAPPISRAKWRKVSGPFPKNSRLAETIGGDWFDRDCRRRAAVDFRRLIRFLTKADQSQFTKDRSEPTSRMADFDSTRRRFDPCRPNHQEFQKCASLLGFLQNSPANFAAFRFQKVSVCFQ